MVAGRMGALPAAWRHAQRCEQCSMRQLVLFGELTPEDLDLIHLPILETELAKGASLYHAGDEGRAIFTLQTGLIKLAQFLPDGQQRIVRVLAPGSTFGLEVLVGRGYAHSAIALEAAILCRIPVEVVERLQRETPRLHGNLMRRWQAALDEADGWLTQLSTGKAQQRVARLLLRILQPDGTASLFSREDLGAILAITTEHASRIVADFRRNGIITLHGERYRCDRRQLEAIADTGAG